MERGLSFHKEDLNGTDKHRDRIHSGVDENLTEPP